MNNTYEILESEKCDLYIFVFYYDLKNSDSAGIPNIYQKILTKAFGPLLFISLNVHSLVQGCA